MNHADYEDFMQNKEREYEDAYLRLLDNKTNYESKQKIISKDKIIESREDTASWDREKLSIFRDQLFSDEGSSEYPEYLMTKLRLNPDELTLSESEYLRKIEFCLKLHDDVALKLKEQTLLGQTLRVVHS